MKFNKFGNTGMKVSELCLGTMQFGWRVNEEESHKIMDKALDLGINFFDTADIYTKWAENSYPGKTEEIIGRWMQKGNVRDDLILATKLRGDMSTDINNRGLSRRHVNQAILGSLDRLQTDWIDLYQIHSFDNDTPIKETLHGMNRLIDNGVVNYIGASNLPAWKFMESLWVANEMGYQRFESLQPVYNIARRIGVEQHYEEILSKYDIACMPYSPLGAGFLTGKYKRGEDLPDTPRSAGVKSRYIKDRNFDLLDAITEIAVDKEATIAQVSLRWVMDQEFITSPIIGANSVEQLEENVGACDIQLSASDKSRLNELSDWRKLYDEIR